MNQTQILIVDDNAHLRKTLADILALKGYEPLTAETGQEALELFRQYSPSVLLLDLKLRDMDGLSIMKTVKNEGGSKSECIVLTGYASQTSAIEAINLGAYSYVQKPCDIDQLLLTIRRAIEKHATEAALEESQRFLATLIANLPGMAYRCRNDRQWTMEFVSQGCFDLTGYQVDDLLLNRAISYAQLIHPDDREYVWKQIQFALRHQRSFELEYRLLTATGQEKWVWERGRGIHPADRRRVTFEGFITDITKRKHAEDILRRTHDDLERRVSERTAALQKAQEAAEAANRAKSVFLTNMSHDLRTPLNAILGYSQMFSQAENLTERQIKGLQTITHSGNHLLTLIDEILDLSKVEAGHMELTRTTFSLRAFLVDITTMIQIRARQQHLIFFQDFATNLPASVSADEKRLRQVLINLLGNAIKFTQEGQVTFRVIPVHSLLPQNQEDVLLRFEIVDTGIGISEEDQEAIFEPFYQVNEGNRYTPSEGTGLGLAISWQLVELMGGQLSVESREGEGSRFWFDISLPVIKAFSATADEQFQQNITGYNGKRRRILVVDDNRVNRAVLAELLGSLDFEVIEAHNGKEGVEQAIAHQPDLIFLDLKMPVMNGIEAAQVMRQRDIQSPIIAISASVSKDTQQQLLSAGCNDFITKPFRMNRVLATLQAHLRLNWINTASQSPSEEPPGHDELAVLVAALPSDIVPSLTTYAERGNQKKVLQQIAAIAALEERFEPLATTLRAYAQNFDLNAIVELIKAQ